MPAFVGSQWLGIIAAGALLFVLAPIQKMADRLADKAVPSGDPKGVSEAEETYRVTLAKYLIDGKIASEEERHLARLATRLRRRACLRSARRGQARNGLAG